METVTVTWFQVGIFLVFILGLYVLPDLIRSWRLRHVTRWMQTSPDAKMAALAMGLEFQLFPPGETNDTSRPLSGDAARNLRLLLRWAQAPLVRTAMGTARESAGGVD